jgi:hypothetical protein
MRRIHVFRAGRHAPMSGGSLEFSEADLAATARAYDPAKHEAPIVVGHPKLDAPAYGWVGSLAVEGGDLFAAPRQVEPAFAEIVEAGRFKKISASFFTPQNPDNPVPGTYYLKHVGFLGAAAPAVKGLKPIEFATDDAGTVTVEFGDVPAWRLGWLFSDVAALFRGVGAPAGWAGGRATPGPPATASRPQTRCCPAMSSSGSPMTRRACRSRRPPRRRAGSPPSAARPRPVSQPRRRMARHPPWRRSE